MNWRVANGNWKGTNLVPKDQGRNLHSRGYEVIVGKNSRDDGFLANVEYSENHMSDMHIATHSNGFGEPFCGGTEGSYFLAMYDADSPTDKQLATALFNQLAPLVEAETPPELNSSQAQGLDSLAELDKPNREFGDAYIELQFHNNDTSQEWIYEKSRYVAWKYGFAIDGLLGHP